MIPLGNNSSPTSYPSLCLSLFISHPFSPSTVFLSIFVCSFFSSSSNNSPDSWPSLSKSDPLCLQMLRYICWRAECSSGRPSPAQHPTACIAASVQLMNTTEGMCRHPSSAFFFCLISFALNRGTVCDDSARNAEQKHRVR